MKIYDQCNLQENQYNLEQQKNQLLCNSVKQMFFQCAPHTGQQYKGVDSTNKEIDKALFQVQMKHLTKVLLTLIDTHN